MSFDAPAPPARAAAKPQMSQPPARRDVPGEARPPSATTMEAIDRVLAEALTRARQFPTSSNHRRVAAEYRRLRILDKAYDHLTVALQIDPKCGEAFAERAQLWRDWGFSNLGLGDAYRAVYFAPHSPSAANTLGTLLQVVGARAAARDAYRRALELDPHAAYSLSNLCYLSFLEGHQADAVNECEAALREEPGLGAARNNLALSYAASGRLQEAREQLLRGDDPARAAFNVGILYMATGQYKLAEQAFHSASNLRPDFVMARAREQQAAKRAAVMADPYAPTIRD